ncbi:WG repeat-containing protein [Taibaiella chishuiensis]|uniref:WG repeat protein n=1 Tax=Taibaiella chishuiensis TaxID=1434707 RepID=A0A2P8CX78_9BACT|nr:WG repeat-containing protein [Taibaiella chishuiensis]PSK89578.1 WG repeat protein [Taibaiella chishuiensis]
MHQYFAGRWLHKSLKKIILIIAVSMPAHFVLGQAPPLQRFYENAKVGYRDAQGHVTVAAQYDAGSEFSNGYAIVVQNGRRGYLNAGGQVQVPLIYRDAQPFTGGYAAVKLADRYGFIDESGSWVIQPVYEAVYAFAAGRALVKKDNLYGFIDTTLCEVIAPRYRQATGFSEGLALVWETDGRCRFVDSGGKAAIATAFDDARPFHGGKAEVLRQGKWYRIDRDGQVLGELIPQPAAVAP